MAVSEVFTFSMTVDRECVNVSLVEDDILENPENLLLDLDTDDPMVILSPEQAEVIINDTSRKYIIIGKITPFYLESIMVFRWSSKFNNEGSPVYSELCEL